MSAYRLVIAPAAKSDLKDIYQYGLQQWGPAQSNVYLDQIKALFWTLTEQPLIGVERPELLTGARSLVIKSHTLFYKVTTDAVEILRILHSRQDPLRHLR